MAHVRGTHRFCPAIRRPSRPMTWSRSSSQWGPGMHARMVAGPGCANLLAIVLRVRPPLSPRTASRVAAPHSFLDESNASGHHTGHGWNIEMELPSTTPPSDCSNRPLAFDGPVIGLTVDLPAATVSGPRPVATVTIIACSESNPPSDVSAQPTACWTVGTQRSTFPVCASRHDGGNTWSFYTAPRQVRDLLAVSHPLVDRSGAAGQVAGGTMVSSDMLCLVEFRQ